MTLAPRTRVAEDRVRAHLEAIYDARVAAEWTPRLLARMDAAERGFAAPFVPPEDRLGPETSVLITYADQVRHEGEPPLRTLRRLLHGPLDDAVAAVHLLPFFPSTSDDGFAVADYDRVDPAYGDWDDVAALGARHDLMFDAVLNHASASHPWFRGWLDGDPAYDGWFLEADPTADLSATVRPRTTPLLTPFATPDGTRHVWTTFGPDQVDLNYRTPAVLDAMAGVLLDYARRGARLLRLDAVTYLWKEPGTSSVHLPRTHEIVRLIRTVLEACTPGVVVITETNVPHAENVSYFGRGDDEAQMVYNFALPPLALHAFHRGDARILRDWARGLTTPGSSTAFFNFLASHDGIGVRPVEGILPGAESRSLADRVRRHGGLVSAKTDVGGGESPYELNVSLYDALNEPERSEDEGVRRMVTAHALMLALPGVPALYVHSLLGSRNDLRRLRETGRARSINRGRFDWATLRRELADPAHRRARVLAGIRGWLRIRARHPAFDPAAPATWPDAPDGVAAVVRHAPDGSAVACLHEIGGTGARLDLARTVGRSSGRADGRTDARAATREARDLGSGAPMDAGAEVALGPYETRWIALPG